MTPKDRARLVVVEMKRDGRWHPTPCEVCGCAKVEGHHDDYGRPDVVRFLCRRHHQQEHARIAMHDPVAKARRLAATYGARAGVEIFVASSAAPGWTPWAVADAEKRAVLAARRAAHFGLEALQWGRVA